MASAGRPGGGTEGDEVGVVDTGVILPLAAQVRCNGHAYVSPCLWPRSCVPDSSRGTTTGRSSRWRRTARSPGRSASVDAPILPRSCNKPIQALAMVRLGLDLPPELLALACASHSGETFHIDGVRRILDRAGLDESALQTPPGYPLDDETLEKLLRTGGEQEPDPDELLGQARSHARHLCGQRLGHDDLPRPEDPLQVAIGRDVRRAHRRAGDHGGDRRLRRAAALDLAGRAGPRLPQPGGRRGRAGDRVAEAIRATPRTSPAPTATRSRCSTRSRARSARPARSPVTPSRWPTAGRSRSRPTTALPGYARC